MIEISINKDLTGFKKIRVSGHSLFSEYGQDIVCAGVSALTIGIINGLTEICRIPNLKIQSDDGFIELEIPNTLNSSEKQLVDYFLKTLILSYEQIQETYPAEIKLINEEN